MKVAILGAGFSGLTAAYELNKAGHEVYIYEKNSQPGGAAGGFKEKDWDWYLDYAYHHWFTNDHDILNLCKEIGWDKILTTRPITASLYGKDVPSISTRLLRHTPSSLAMTTSPIPRNDDEMIYKLDSPLDLLRFPRISVIDRIRAGIVLAILKFGPPFAAYHKVTSYALLNSLMGKKAFGELFKPLFEKKFGTYASQINTMFMWARITKRTPALSYPEGGYQTLANYFGDLLEKKGIHINYGCEITSVARVNSKFEIRKSKQTKTSLRGAEATKPASPAGGQPSTNSGLLRHIPPGLAMTTSPISRNDDRNIFDVLINTLPSPVFLKLEKDVLPENYRTKIAGIKYLGAQTIILETKEPILDRTYWLNLANKNNPFMVAIQHTNFMDKQHFNNHHLFYLATYTNKPLIAHLESRISGLIKKWEFTIPYAQPLYTTDYIDHMPHIKTPVPGLYFANMELTYPYDRGTNYAVKVGKEVAAEILRA